MITPVEVYQCLETIQRYGIGGQVFGMVWVLRTDESISSCNEIWLILLKTEWNILPPNYLLDFLYCIDFNTKIPCDRWNMQHHHSISISKLQIVNLFAYSSQMLTWLFLLSNSSMAILPLIAQPGQTSPFRKAWKTFNYKQIRDANMEIKEYL